METSELARKLQLKAGQRVLVLGGPESYLAALPPLPEGAALATVATGQFDVVHFFARTTADLAARAPAALGALKPDGILWVSYPKGGSRIKTDLNRDQGWSVLTDAGWQGVRQVAIDEDWSALRFKRAPRNAQDPLAGHFTGPRAALRPIYDRILAAVQALGSDVEVGVRESYIAFRRGQQFAVVKTRTRPLQIELGLRLPGQPPGARLEEVGKSFGSESSNVKVILSTPVDVDEAVQLWLKTAYDAA
jgi:predicted transport protein